MKKYKVSYRKEKHIPHIRISGKWLKTIGFEPGIDYSVEIRKNQLILSIKKESNNE